MRGYLPRADIFMSASPPPPPPTPTPLSAGLLITDGSVCTLYSFSSSIAGLFTSGEYLEATLDVTAQDIVDLAVAFDSALALALGWCLASAVTGVCSEEWWSLSAEDHSSSALGVSGVLRNWIVGWPLGELLRTLALAGIVGGGWATVGEVPSMGLVEVATKAASDGAGLLVCLTLWRSFLLNWWARF